MKFPSWKGPRQQNVGRAQPASPGGKTEGKEKDEAASSDVLPTGDSDTGQSDTAQSRAQAAMARRGVGQKDMRQNVQWGDTGQTDMEQKDMGVGRGLRWSSRGQMDVGQDEMARDDMGQKDMRRGVQWSDAGQSDVGQKGVGKSVRWSDRGGTDMGQDDMEQEDMGQEDMEQIKKEEMEIDISEVEALPSSLDSPPEMASMEEIKEEEAKMGISKAPPHVPTRSSDGTTSETHPRAPGSHVPVQRVQSVQGPPGSQDLWVPAESVAGPSSRLPTPREARGEGGLRMEAFPADAGRMFLRVPSAEYLPCDPLVKMSAQRPGFLPSTPPASPGLSMRLARLRRQEQRDEAADGYSRRSPMYSGGKHTSVSPVQRMEPLLPDPNLPGTYELMGKDGVVYPGPDCPGLSEQRQPAEIKGNQHTACGS
ncbi:uncharacterized protein GJ701_013020 [Geothlypis trichas]